MAVMLPAACLLHPSIQVRGEGAAASRWPPPPSCAVPSPDVSGLVVYLVMMTEGLPSSCMSREALLDSRRAPCPCMGLKGAGGKV